MDLVGLIQEYMQSGQEKDVGCSSRAFEYTVFKHLYKYIIWTSSHQIHNLILKRCAGCATFFFSCQLYV